MSQQQFDVFIDDMEYLKDNLDKSDILMIMSYLYDCYTATGQGDGITYEDILNNLDAYLKAYNDYVEIAYKYLLPGFKSGVLDANMLRIFDDNDLIILNIPTPPTLKSNNTSNSNNSSSTSTINDKVLEVLSDRGYINNYTDKGRI